MGPNEAEKRPVEAAIAALAAAGIAAHGLARLAGAAPAWRDGPLYAVLVLGGLPLVAGILRKLARRELGADVLAGISMGAAAAMGKPLVAAVLVLMLSGGGALERFAARRASSVLDALARRMPQVAHRRAEGGL